jgi:parallel beta-helix repeat protein
MATAMLAGGNLTPSAANAATYYVAKTGSDSKSCTSAQATSSPKLTIKSGLNCLKAGDTLSIRAGTYNEVINSQSQTVPPGTSWDSPVTITAYSGETVTLRPSSGYAAIQVVGNDSKYIIFNRLIIDGINTSDFAVSLDGLNQSGAGYIRFTNCEIRNAPRSGVLTGRKSNFNKFIDCNIHDNGREHVSYGVYIQSSNNLIEGGKIHHNSGYGVHVYNGHEGQRANDNIVRRTRAYNNSTREPDQAGILIGSGDGNMAYNNIAYGQRVGIMVGFNGSTNSKVYNNTVYNNSFYGIHIRASSSSAIVKNNITYSNGTNIQNYAGSKTIQSKNLTTNPSFTNASEGNFTLRSGSEAINAGTTLSQVSDDFKGTPRPQGGSFDIGAYEYGASQTASSLSAPTNLQLVVQ